MAAMENTLTGGPKMFSTVHGDKLHNVTGGLANADTQLASLMNKHGARKFWAAVKAQGLEPEDVDQAAAKDAITVHKNVPAESAKKISDDRSKMWEDLRQSRLRAVESTLEGLSDDQVRRYWKCESGINPVSEKDLPAVDTLAGMDKFNDMQESHQRKVKAEQARKAMALGIDFLTEKKKREDADAKVAAFEKRIAEYKKEQEETWKQKRIASEKKAEKRTADAARAAAARREWEDETEAHLWDRFTGARARRTHNYSTDGMAAKLEANKQKRMAAFAQATELEHHMLNNLEDRRIACEERLEVRRQEVEANLAQQRANSQASFQKRQVMVHAKTTEWVENMLEAHGKFKQHVEDSRDAYKNNLKEKSKSTGDIRKKAFEKVRVGKERLKNSQDESNNALMERHAAADDRRRELNTMAFKNDNDIFTFREIKHNTFGELTKRRNTEIKKRFQAEKQALVYHLAEKHCTSNAQKHSTANLFKCRQQIAKESLTFMDNANEGFLKIQSEPDESKVIATMNALGFDMPKLPEKDEDAGEEEAGKAF
jgi:hypothetical protein